MLRFPFFNICVDSTASAPVHIQGEAQMYNLYILVPPHLLVFMFFEITPSYLYAVSLSLSEDLILSKKLSLFITTCCLLCPPPQIGVAFKPAAFYAWEF